MMAEAVSVSPVELSRVESASPLRGLGGLTAAELRRWFPWRALTFTGLGLALLAVSYAMWLASPEPRLGTLVFPFFVLWALLLVVVTVATTQGAVAGEIEQGTAAWVVAKPVGRPAFVLSKFLAAVPAVVIGMVAIPGVAARFVFGAAEGRGDTDFRVDEILELATNASSRDEFTTVPEAPRYLGTLLVLATILLVVTAVMVLLGCVLRRTTTILAVGMLAPIAMLVLAATDIQAGFVTLTPAWLMDSLMASVADDPAPLLGPVVVGTTWIAGLLLLASAIFERREL